MAASSEAISSVWWALPANLQAPICTTKCTITTAPLTPAISISKTSHPRSTTAWYRWPTTPETCSTNPPALRLDRALAQLERPSGLLEQSLCSTWNARSALEQPQGSCGPCIVHWQEILSPSAPPLFPLPSPISKACAPCACFLFVANVCFPFLNHAYWVFSCSKRQLLLEFLFFILTFQKKAVSLHPQRIQYSRISSLSLESVVVYPTISAQGYTWRPVSLGLSRRRAHLSARKGGPFFFSASILETIWNYLEPSGTIWNYLERPPASWTARRAIGTAAGFWNALRPWTARRAILYCSLAADIICVPIILWNARRAIGTALRAFGTEPSALPGTPAGFWNRAFGSTWNALGAQGLLESAVFATAATAAAGVRAARQGGINYYL